MKKDYECSFISLKNIKQQKTIQEKSINASTIRRSLNSQGRIPRKKLAINAKNCVLQLQFAEKIHKQTILIL